jgi:hypothetical protein
MRRIAFAFVGLSLVGWQLLGGCESDVTDGGTPTGSGGQGASTTTTTTITGSTTTTGAGGGSGGSGGSGCPDCTNDCEYACYKIENECGFPISCAQIPGGTLDCEGNSEVANCNGACVLEADCGDLPSLLSADPEPTLAACMQACAPPCENCVMQACADELLACYDDTVCQAFLTCLDTEACADFACIEGCLTDNSSTAAEGVAGCTCESCGTDCSYCSGTGGGGQGGGGQGGSGGN